MVLELWFAAKLGLKKKNKRGFFFRKEEMASTSGPNFNVQQQYVPVFEGENYDFWFVKMKTSFLAVDLWDMVETGYKEPESEESLSDTQKKKLKEARQRYANALSMIRRVVADSIFPRIMRATTAQEA